MQTVREEGGSWGWSRAGSAVIRGVLAAAKKDTGRGGDIKKYVLMAARLLEKYHRDVI